VTRHKCENSWPKYRASIAPGEILLSPEIIRRERNR